MSSPLKFCDTLGGGWAGLGRLFDWVLGNLFEYWDHIYKLFINRQDSATYKLSFFLPSSSDETTAQRRIWKARVSSFCVQTWGRRIWWEARHLGSFEVEALLPALAGCYLGNQADFNKIRGNFQTEYLVNTTGSPTEKSQLQMFTWR